MIQLTHLQLLITFPTFQLVCRQHTFGDLTATITVQNLRTDVKYMYKEKFLPIINKRNHMHTYFGEDVCFYVLLKSALIGVYRTVLYQVKHSFVTVFTRTLSFSPL